MFSTFVLGTVHAVYCGTFAAPTTCIVVSGTTQYTFSDFAMSNITFQVGQGKDYLPSKVDVDVTAVTGNRARIRFSKNNSTAGTVFDPGANKAEGFMLGYTVDVRRTVAGDATLDPSFTNALNAVTITGNPFVSNQIIGTSAACALLVSDTAITSSLTCTIETRL